jgi:hypothetical protein
MATHDLTNAIDSLSPQEQEAVREFIGFLKRRDQSSPSAFMKTVNEFVETHPELLKRLAQ